MLSEQDLQAATPEELKRLRELLGVEKSLIDFYPPNSDPQRMFLESKARIAIIGGSAGGGKTIAEFLDLTQHVDLAEYGAILFRRTLKMHKDEGGLWDKSVGLFPRIGGKSNVSEHRWTFPSGASIQFAGLENETSKLDYQGAEIPKIVFDELTHFLESQFFYLLSRNRWPASARKKGVLVPPTIRGSTNPEPGWVKKLLAPWVDFKFPNPAASGEIRWFVRGEANQIVWLDADPPERGICVLGPDGEGCFKEECLKCFPPEISITFIRLSIYDNRDFLKANPEYVTGLKALPEVDRRRLLDGDWDAKPPHLVLDAFSDRNIVSWRALDPKDHNFFIFADFGGHNTAEICVAEEKHSRHLTIIGEDWPGHSRSWDAIGADTKALVPIGGHIKDGAGGNRTGEQGWRQAFRTLGIPMSEPLAEHADPKLQYQVLNDLFRSGELDVFETCSKFIEMAGRFIRKKDPKTGDVTDDFDDAPFHLLACARYGAVKLRPPKKLSLEAPSLSPRPGATPQDVEKKAKPKWDTRSYVRD